MKRYEEESLEIIRVPAHQPFLIRCDGKSFSTFTRGLTKPFDVNFGNAMQYATKDAMRKFKAVCAYTHSDKITLLFAAQKLDDGVDRVHDYSGRTAKILTLVASYISVRFNHYLREKCIWDPETYSRTTYDRMISNEQVFDARLMMVPEGKEMDLVNHMIWRSQYDCWRNAVSTLGRSFFSAKQLHGKDVREILEMVKEEHRLDPNDFDPYFFRGVFFKKRLWEVTGKNLMTGEEEVTMRSRVVSWFPEELKATPYVLEMMLTPVLPVEKV